MIMLEKGNTPNILTETWLCDTEEEVNNIPVSTPSGSKALVLTDNGLITKMKNNAGEWKNI